MSESASGSVVFDRAADYYDETRGFPPGEEIAVAALIAQVGGLGSRARVLEVGVGTGRIALPLAARVGLMMGIDLSLLMLERLRAKQRGEPIRVALADATRLPLPARAFDAVVGVHIFHLIPAWPTALREVARVLRPGGVLITGYNDAWRSDGPEGIVNAAWDAAIGAGREVNVGLPRSQYQTFLPDSGWRPLAEPAVYTYPVRRQVATLLDQLERGVWSSCWRLSEAQRAAGLAAVRAALDEHGIDPLAWHETERRFVAQAFAPPTEG